MDLCDKFEELVTVDELTADDPKKLAPWEIDAFYLKWESISMCYYNLIANELMS